MANKVIRIDDLPEHPLDAANGFYAGYAANIRDDLRARPGLNVVIVFETAGKEHRGWQLAAVQDLAREATPGRVNAVVGGGEDGIAQTLAWLERAPGITGQLLPLDPTGAEISKIGAI
jgi:hypothetical protein